MSKRDAILSCAETLILRDGSSGLTLDRIALEAQVSKGGLLYHFPTKEDLVIALVDRTIQFFERDLAHYKQKLGGGPGSTTLAYALASLRGPWARQVGLANHGLEFLAAVLAVFAMKPELMEPLRMAYARWQTALRNDGIDPMRATIIQLAVDGLWFNESLGFMRFTPDEQEAILTELKRYCLPSNPDPLVASASLLTEGAVC